MPRFSDADRFSDTGISVSGVGQFHVNSWGAASWIDHTLNVHFKLTHDLGVAALVSVRSAWYVYSRVLHECAHLSAVCTSASWSERLRRFFRPHP